jgi:hypothetical protein
MPPEYDDDDFLPPSRSAAAPNQTRTKSFIVLAMVGVAVGAIALLVILRGHRATEQARAVAAQQRQVAEVSAVSTIERPIRKEIRTRPAASAPRGNPGENWRAAIGTWRREIMHEYYAAQPVEFVFRPDFTARVLQRSPTTTFERETLVEVSLDEGDTLTVVMHEQNGRLSLRFRVMEDGTLFLNSFGPPTIYTRVK